MNPKVVNILDLIKQEGENCLNKWLSSFSCDKDPDIEHFLKHNAVNFSKQGIAITYLVLEYGTEENYLLGYFTITYKVMQVYRNDISRTTAKRLARFGDYDCLTDSYSVPAPLIAQFGKNSAVSASSEIRFTGSKLMELALDQIQRIHHMAGGRVVYLECEDNPFLLDLYSRNGYITFSKRYPSAGGDEPLYHQMLKILK